MKNLNKILKLLMATMLVISVQASTEKDTSGCDSVPDPQKRVESAVVKGGGQGGCPAGEVLNNQGQCVKAGSKAKELKP